MIATLAAALVGSLLINAYQYKGRRKGPKSHPSAELNAFVGDLATGGLVYMKRIDPQDFILRSPKRKA